MQQLRIDNCESLRIINLTISQSECQEWFEQKKKPNKQTNKQKKKKKKYRITSSNAHKCLIRQKNFGNLTENLFVKFKKCSNMTQEPLNHGKKFEPIARQIYIDVIKLKLKHNFSVGETSIVIHPLLYWLAASPDEFITGESGTLIFGSIEIKCTFSKRNLDPEDMLKDKSFYVELQDGMPHIKEEHSNGYHSQIKMAMVYLI